MLRTFVAIDIPDELREQLGRIYGGIPGARWLDEEDMHLTLRFVGEVEGHVFEVIANALDEVKVPSFELSLKGVGHFPPRKEPKVLWVGVDKSEGLERLQRRVDRVIVECGLPPEGRKFYPHITVARLNGSPSSKVAQFLQTYALLESDPWVVDEFHLYTSILRERGAEYTREYSYDLPRPQRLSLV